MSQMPQQLLVAEFMQKLGRITLPEKLTNLTYKEINLCKSLIEEEFIKEFLPALSSENLKDILDASMDSIYVILYTLNLMGFYKTVEAFELVHKSNMTKLWFLNEVKEACKNQMFEATHHILQPVEETPDRRKCILVKRKSDGKVIKSPSYVPVDFTELLK